MADGIKDGKVVAGVFANMVGVTPRDIQMLCKNASISAEKIGGVWYIPFPKGLQEYIKIYKDKAEGRGGAGREELERKKLMHDTELKESKAKLAKLELEERMGKLHSADIVEDVLNDFVFYVRSAILAIPSRIATELSRKLEGYFGKEKPPASIISSMIADEVNLILSEFTNYQYDAEKMEQKRREQQGADDILDEDDE